MYNEHLSCCFSLCENLLDYVYCTSFFLLFRKEESPNTGGGVLNTKSFHQEERAEGAVFSQGLDVLPVTSLNLVSSTLRPLICSVPLEPVNSVPCEAVTHGRVLALA